MAATRCGADRRPLARRAHFHGHGRTGWFTSLHTSTMYAASDMDFPFRGNCDRPVARRRVRRAVASLWTRAATVCGLDPFAIASSQPAPPFSEDCSNDPELLPLKA